MKTKITFTSVSKNIFHIDKTYKMRGFEKIYSWRISNEKFYRVTEFEYNPRNVFMGQRKTIIDCMGYFEYPIMKKLKIRIEKETITPT